MIHLLTLGHLDVEAVQAGRVVVRKPLDMDLVLRLLREIGEVDEHGNAKLGGYPVIVKDGYVTCTWLAIGPNRHAETFARRLHEETGCVLAEVKRRRIVRPDDFRSCG